MNLKSFAVVIVVLSSAEFAVAAKPEALGCTASSYAAVFVPWTDQANRPQLWLIPAGERARSVTLESADIGAISCGPEAVLLRSTSSVLRLALDASAFAVEPAESWARQRADHDRVFRLNKGRIIAFGRSPRRQLVIARAEGGTEGEAEVFTAVLVASMSPSGDASLLFSVHNVAITVD